MTVANVDAALAFYGELLGFEQELCLKDENGQTYLGSVEVGSTVIMFMNAATSGRPVNPQSSITLQILFPKTFDLDALYSRLRDRSVRIIREPGDRPWGRDFCVTDPDGYYIVFST